MNLAQQLIYQVALAHLTSDRTINYSVELPVWIRRLNAAADPKEQPQVKPSTTGDIENRLRPLVLVIDMFKRGAITFQPTCAKEWARELRDLARWVRDHAPLENSPRINDLYANTLDSLISDFEQTKVHFSYQAAHFWARQLGFALDAFRSYWGPQTVASQTKVPAAVHADITRLVQFAFNHENDRAKEAAVNVLTWIEDHK